MNSNYEKVSIIMGVYNGSNRFVDAVQSIESQTYKNWELIICDDGSTDDSYDKLCQYALQNSKIRVIKNDKNSGLAATLNHCLEYCDSKYVARMDDDDLSYPERFQRQVNFLEEHPEISFVSSSVDIFDGEKIVGKRTQKEFPTKKDLIWNTRFIHPATMFRTEDINAVGGYRVSKETVRGQDYDLFMRMYGQGFHGANIQDSLFRYTEDQNNFKRRTFQARIGEYKIRCYGYKSMRVMPWGAPFVLKPFLAYVVSLIKNRTRRIAQ